MTLFCNLFMERPSYLEKLCDRNSLADLLCVTPSVETGSCFVVFMCVTVQKPAGVSCCLGWYPSYEAGAGASQQLHGSNQREAIGHQPAAGQRW